MTKESRLDKKENPGTYRTGKGPDTSPVGSGSLYKIIDT